MRTNTVLLLCFSRGTKRSDRILYPENLHPRIEYASAGRKDIRSLPLCDSRVRSIEPYGQRASNVYSSSILVEQIVVSRTSSVNLEQHFILIESEHVGQENTKYPLTTL